MTEYEHRQTGSWVICAIGLPALIFLVVGAFLSATRPALFLACVLLLCTFLFWKLTIKIVNGTLRASFGLGLIHKTVPVADIVGVSPFGSAGGGVGGST
jgi:hypothetical protein